MCVKKIIYVKKYIWNPSTCICENGKYLISIMNDSVNICDKIIDPFDKTKLFQQILMKRKQPEKRKIFVIYYHFY